MLISEELATFFAEPRSLVSSNVNSSLKNSWPSCRDTEGQVLHLPQLDVTAWLQTVRLAICCMPMTLAEATKNQDALVIH